MNLVLDYPIWFVWLCALGGALSAFLLYLRDKKLVESPAWLVWLMAVLRFGATSIIALLLLGPLIKEQSEIIEKPVIIIGHDNSESILFNKDSSYYEGEYARNFRQFVDKLSQKFEVSYYHFGGELDPEAASLDFSEKQSDLSQFFTEVQSRFSNRNIGAVVMASDGISNKGLDPMLAASRIKNTGVYTIALGDTVVKRDLSVEKLDFNSIAYLGNDFPLKVMVRADKLKGRKTRLNISHAGKTIVSREIEINQSALLQNFSFRIEADKPGIQKYTITLDSVDGEFTLDNNSKTIFVNVQNNKQQVLVLAHAPHPDIGAIKNAIEGKQGYNVTVKMARDFNGEIDNYGLVILHQLPSRSHPSDALLTQVQNKKKPVLFIFGAATAYGKFNELKTGFSHIGFNGRMDDIRPGPGLQSNFSLFNISETVKKAINEFPVIHTPFSLQGVQTSNSVNTLISLALVTPQGAQMKGPLVAFNSWNDSRIGLIAGEGVFRWSFKNPSAFSELFQKVVQYLATKEDKSFFRILGKNEFNENEEVIFDAEVFNETYELINTPEIKMILTNEAGEDIPQSFVPDGRGYRMNAGKLPAGKYTYRASVTVNGREYNLSKDFIVKSIRIEYANGVADHQVLYNIATQNGGEMVYPDQLDQLYDKIMSRDDLIPVSYPQTKFKDLINWWQIFFLLLILLGLEWFLRKRNGAY